MILVRHGESHFNRRFSVSRQDPGIKDPGLTEDGVRQAHSAAEIIASLQRTTRIIASPYWRTLQTAEIIAEHLGLSVQIDSLVREQAAFSCDVGSPRSALSSRWPAFVFGALAENWWPAETETEEHIRRRSREFHEVTIAEDDWHGTLVVTHWGFIRALTEERVPNGAVLGFDPRDRSVVRYESPHDAG
jgi:broad specificity phosphatase PhoE